jgi:hypothetical protein
MKNLLTATLCILCYGLFSCQKEVDDILAPTGQTGNNTTGLLAKMVITDGSDSSVYNYSYNGSNKIIGINTTDVTSGISSTTNETAVRNSQGIIQKITTKSSDFSQYGIDSIISVINYDAVSKQYKSKLIKLGIPGFTFKDSTVFTYDASGKIATETDYLDDGTGNTQASKFEFTYTGTNLTGMKGYDLSSGTPVLQISYVFEYDAKASPLILGNEAFLFNNAFQWLSANNMLKMTTNLVGDPITHLTTYAYNYNSQNKPVLANVVSDGQTVGTISYSYY